MSLLLVPSMHYSLKSLRNTGRKIYTFAIEKVRAKKEDGG